MTFNEYADYDGLGLAELVRRKEIVPAELVEAAIERIERHDPTLNAVVFRAFDEARSRARQLTSTTDLPFAGVPMLLKDIGAVRKGWPTRQWRSNCASSARPIAAARCSARCARCMRRHRSTC